LVRLGRAESSAIASQILRAAIAASSGDGIDQDRNRGAASDEKFQRWITM
jgi:hypothetical protein